jgi:hypothetical protein
MRVSRNEHMQAGKEADMSEIKTETVYFAAGGRANTERTLELAYARAQALGIETMLVATTSGETAVRAAQLCAGMTVIAVTHSTGYRAPDTQELTAENRAAIEAAGGQILTCQHALGGVNRAVRKKFATFELDEIIAHTLRTFGQGVKVVIEIALMAADAGLVRTDTPVMAVGGSGRGADTAAVVLPTNAQTFFDIKVPEIVCRPSPAHPLAEQQG